MKIGNIGFNLINFKSNQKQIKPLIYGTDMSIADTFVMNDTAAAAYTPINRAENAYDEQVKNLSGMQRKKIQLMLQRNIDFNEAVNIASDKTKEQIFKKLSLRGVPARTAAFCANVEGIEKHTDKEVKQFLRKYSLKKHRLTNCDKSEIETLKANCANSPYYTPSEYLDGFIFAKSFKTPTGENIFYDSNDLMNIDPKSLNASYIQAMLDFIKEGRIPAGAMKLLSSQSEISPNMKKDIDLIFDCIAKNERKSRLEREILAKYIPDVENIKEGLKKTEIGDVFKVDGEKYIRIKTDEEKSKLLSIKKETYARLFPPAERFATRQGDMGTCYLNAALFMIYSNPKERVRALETFKEDERGNIEIKFPNDSTITRFNNGMLPKSARGDRFFEGCSGFKMLAYAYANTVETNLIKKIYRAMPKNKRKDFKNFISEYGKNIFLMKDKYDKVSYTTFENALDNRLYEKFNKYCTSTGKNRHYDTYLQYLTGNGGTPADIFYLFDYSVAEYKSQQRKTPTHKEYSRFYEKYLPDVVQGNLSEALEALGALDKNITTVGIESHAFGLEGRKDENNNTSYYLYNPHYPAVPVKINKLSNIKIRQAVINK